MFSFRNFKQSYQKFWLGYISFKERTNRKDYWLAMLGHGVLTLCLLILAGLFNLLSNDVLPDIWSVFSYFFIGLWGLYSLVAALPFCAIAVRRLRDTGLPWELIFILIVPFGGFLSMLILNALPSSKSQAGMPEFSQPVYRTPKIQEMGHESFFQAIKNYFVGYVSFRGRSSRLSFWMVQLSIIALFTVLGLLFSGTQLFENIFFGHAFLASWLLLFIIFLIALGLFLPTLALFTRRFRDAGLSNFGIVLLFFSAASLNLLRNIIHTVDVASFGIRDFSLLNYLLFLATFVFVALIIFVAVQDKDQLAQKERTLLFRKRG